ncbi:Nucleotide-binding universal stress protein, UspA family [Sulfobacillus thermosulfidooxidans DSM 9293]|uniref:Nucleotide-binding universal stress protein, UspA family n=1 Tax=Sulfobacillus thermosulfidooxidans (strain DSM 9293 / VKM B-1269 / AT-1) TaxID=929705 RepID=A0A1W1WCS6_SULTA|nr:universal stress protein [Sulfobacillus thermosulfidooxidans]SMC04096.1 Nucleotide-binding universal stress protein, UspA family [Sulfobacillus thermosulfidooxidans DSM 9293]
MFTKVAVAVDGSEASYHALSKALERTGDEGQLLLIDVKDIAAFIQPMSLGTTYGTPVATENLQLLLDEWDKNAEAVHQKAQKMVESTKIHAEWRIVTVEEGEGTAAQAFFDAATKWGADVIVVGRHQGSRFIEGMFGSFPRWLVTHSTLPVLIVPPAAK